jgi:pyrophosphatase PpaX
MNKFEGIIFDVDGTLTSTNELIFETFRHVVKKYSNKDLSNEEIISLFGPTEDVILKEWYKDKFEEARKDYYSFYRDNHHMADLYPGIIEILKYLKEKNVLLSIYTGKGKEAAEITLKTLNVFDYFDLIITGDDVEEHKPSAEGIIKFVEKFNLSKESVLMIGDSTGDIKAARSANVKIASVVWDSYAKAEVLKLKSDFVFETVEELNGFLKDIYN